MSNSSRSQRVLIHVLWNWAGVIVLFFAAFFLSPYVIKRLGEQRYGIWALAFSFIDYFTLFDFGFKPAVVVFCSRARQGGDTERINRILTTTFIYFSCVGFVLAMGTGLLAGRLAGFFHISSEFRDEFIVLIRFIAAGWGTAMALSVFNAATEAFELFQGQSVIMTVSMIVRSGGCAIALYLGYGLGELGAIVWVSQLCLFGAIFLYFRSSYQEMRIRWEYFSWEIWRELAAYGKHVFVGGLGNILLTQGPPLAVGRFLSEASVGYYALPWRLLQNLVDLVTRTGYVTVPNAAAMNKEGERESIWRMGMYLNRYCFILFMPLCVFLLFFGRALIGRWVGPEFARQSAPLLPPLLLMTSFAVAGQFNSSQILYGLAKHKTYSWLIAGEAVLVLGLLTVVLPRWGLLGGVWVVSGLALINRGLITPWLLSRVLGFSLVSYLWGIFGYACGLGLGLAALAQMLRVMGIVGGSWVELIGVLGSLAGIFYAASFFLLVEPGHRGKIIDLGMTQWRRLLR